MRLIPAILRPALAALAGSVVIGLTGCVASGYRPAPENTPPAVPLGWSAGTSPLDFTLEAVITYQGPGSWKANAYWDEYVVTLRNRGTAPVFVERAMLQDFQQQYAVPGDKPWDLEKLSQTQTAKLNSTLGNIVHVGSGVVLPVSLGVMVVTGGAAMAGSSGMAMAVPMASAGSVIGSVVLPVVLPIAVGTTVYRNVSNKHDIEEEFVRRRLVLPLKLAPGQELAGSLFFPVTPGPRRLQFQLAGQALLDAVELPLPLLAEMHLKTEDHQQLPAWDENRPVPMQPVVRNGKRYVPIAMDTTTSGGEIVVNGGNALMAPTVVEIEVDALGRTVERSEITGNLRSSRGISSRLLGKLVIPEGTIPPAKVEFSQITVRQVPYTPPTPAPLQAP